MARKIKEFVKRAPRYMITPEDNCLCKFSKEHESESLTVEFHNISSTGLAFITDRDFAPQFGETIKLQFTLPHLDHKLEWWGRVVRMHELHTRQWWQNQDEKEDLVVVAVHFQNFPEGQKENIEQALRKQFVELRRKKRLQWILGFIQFLSNHKWKIIGISSLIVFTVAFLYFISRPSENYDAKRGSPWGQRFKSLIWTDD